MPLVGTNYFLGTRIKYLLLFRQDKLERHFLIGFKKCMEHQGQTPKSRAISDKLGIIAFIPS